MHPDIAIMAGCTADAARLARRVEWHLERHLERQLELYLERQLEAAAIPSMAREWAVSQRADAGRLPLRALLERHAPLRPAM